MQGGGCSARGVEESTSKHFVRRLEGKSGYSLEFVDESSKKRVAPIHFQELLVFKLNMPMIHQQGKKIFEKAEI